MHMYGTIFRLRVKPGAGDQVSREMQSQADESIPGHVATVAYQSDARPDEFWVSVVFESREAYLANAESPAQDSRYRRLRDLLVEDPEWHDGEVVHRMSR
jgi:quinol monooxygenase YgiN